MFDLKTFKVLGRIPAAEDADAIIYDRAVEPRLHVQRRRALVDRHRPAAGTLITNIPLGGKPEYGASAGDGKVYANLTDTSEVVEIDAKTRDGHAALVDRAVQAAGRDGDRHRASPAVQRLPQRRDGRVRLPGGQGRRDGADRRGRRRRRLRSASGDAFASNADGTLTVIHQDAPGSVSRHPDAADGRRRRATWGSIPRITASSSWRRSSGRRPPAAAAEDRSCPARSAFW